MTSSDLDWRDTELGTRVRVALWLRDEVGVGNTFSKAALRAAISGAEQVDRRMRDLRPAGWVIRTNLDRPSLQPEQLYLETIGAPVWERGCRAAGLRQISARTRRYVYERDLHMCRRCGIGAAEAYPGEPGSKARLTLGHVSPHAAGGTATAEGLITECARCNELVRNLTGVQMDSVQVWERVRALPVRQKQELLEWMTADVRPLRPVERVWGLYRQLPAALRDEMQRDLRELLDS
ncbi:HNH endonuclease signature motif containing protein [Streptomyces sp. SID3915]|uniref:HNH endonuclease n=1 Tax=Streptomyces sp. SID3915 TaxID=2690263 RepID=UPI001371CB5E|nr:HNH endonuclease signature motif containing protein [Streptomyces sp. SID3915]MYX76264.1 HNH endonuclease [Streptomyces sp. SID3915]